MIVSKYEGNTPIGCIFLAHKINLCSQNPNMYIDLVN